ncbi:hypothetical protein [Paenibacillus sp. NPDC058177]|uniref:hypothetical protein n=1 Tax=Paenibacillus sp. NPDC058177 TaxID=3346369 RepID=UPI0036DE819F
MNYAMTQEDVPKAISSKDILFGMIRPKRMDDGGWWHMGSLAERSLAGGCSLAAR